MLSGFLAFCISGMQVGSCTSLQPLLPLQHLQSLFVTGPPKKEPDRLRFPSCHRSDCQSALLSCLQVGSCTSLQPLLPLQHLQSLVVTGPAKREPEQMAVAYQDLVQLKALTELR